MRANVAMWAAVVLCCVGDGLVLARPGAEGPLQGRAPGSAVQPRPTKNPYEGNPQAITAGGAMFRTRCAACHGPDARGDRGPDISTWWASGGTDERAFDIVRRGVPGTEMTPADPMRIIDRDIWQVLAYLRTLSAVPETPPVGNAENGERLFRVNCNSCHLVNGRGGHLGPDLSRIGSARSRTGLRKKMRGTSDQIRAGYEPVTLVTREGERIRGVKKNEDEFSIQIMDTRERLQGFLKANLTEVINDKQSLMPVYGPDRLNDRDLDDLLQYLAGLRRTDTSPSERR